MIKADEIIQKIEYFPQQPGVSYKIVGLLETPGTTTANLLELLKFDIAGTTNILKLCNSPVYAAKFGFSKPVGSLKEAVDQIGLQEARKIISISASSDIFSVSSGAGYEINRGEIRRHSVASAVISKQLLPYAPQLEGDLFTTALLHDIGKMILDDYIQDSLEQIRSVMDEKKCDFSHAEEEVLGMTHAEAGARILEKWQFPAHMVTAVRFHHDTIAGPDSPLLHFVSLANIIAMMMGFTTGMDAMEYKGFGELYKKYKIKEKNIEYILSNSLEEVQHAIAFERRHEGNLKGQPLKKGQERRKDLKEKWQP